MVRRPAPPLIIMMDLIMVLLVVMILKGERDVIDVVFAQQRVPDGSRHVFRASNGGRLSLSAGEWVPITGPDWAGAVYVECTFCKNLGRSPDDLGVHEIALMGPTARKLRDMVFDICTARQRCRPLRVLITEAGEVKQLQEEGAVR